MVLEDAHQFEHAFEEEEKKKKKKKKKKKFILQMSFIVLPIIKSFSMFHMYSDPHKSQCLVNILHRNSVVIKTCVKIN